MAGDVRGSGQAAGFEQAQDSKGQDSKESPRPASGDAPLALYRRYRPATFAELKGQDHVTAPLRQALRSGRVHHAYLFSGPRGCGKTSSARILARSLNCEAGPTPDPCGVCASCVALGPSGPGSIDVIEIDAASHGGIDDARDLRERAFYSPVAARYKIYIIDEAHMVTGAGFNALLKLVEEPPPHLKFVFATTEPEKVIATIRSRTHHYPFRLVPPAVLRELLEEILGSEKIAYEPSVLPVVIRAGAGSVRDTLSVVDQLIAGSDESGLRYDRAIALLGYTDGALLDEMTDAFATGDGAAVFVAIDHVVEAGHDPRRFAMDLLDRLRDLIVLGAVPGAAASGLLDVPEDRLERMRGQVGRFGQERLVRAAETISSGLVEMRGATSPRLLLELMCAQVLLPANASASGVTPAQSGGPDVLARVERLERQLASRLPGAEGGQEERRAAEARPVAAERPVAGGSGPSGSPGGPSGPGPSGSGSSGSGSSGSGSSGSGSSGSGVSPGDRVPGDRVPGGTVPPRASSGAERPVVAERSAGPTRAPGAAGVASQSGATQTGASSAGAPRSSAPQGGRVAAPVDHAGAGIDEATLRGRWHEVLSAVREVRKTAWILLSNYAAIDSLEGNVLTLAFDAEGNAKGFASSGSDGDLAEILGARFGARLVIRTIVRPGAGRERSGSPATEPGAGAPGYNEPGGRGEGGTVGSAATGAVDAPTGVDSVAGTASAGTAPSRTASAGSASPGTASPGTASRGGASTGPATSTASAPSNGAATSNGPATSARSAMSNATVGQDDPRLDTDPDETEKADGLTGSELIMREFGGEVIEEVGED